MFKINLVPEAKQLQRKIQRANILSTIIAVCLIGAFLLFIIILLGFRVSNVTTNNRLLKNIRSNESELEDYKNLEQTVISLENGLTSIKEITKNSVKWSLFFTELEKAIPADTKFTKLDIRDNQINADVEGTSVDSLARFVQSFGDYKIKANGEEKNLFKNIDTTGYTKSETGNVKFTVKFELIKEVMWPSN
ncbi:MAG: PilN domain-containing protein [Patescibacteria group bacterium]|nr:PilN domain-containing protein [Patescibacteria group bacterium]MCL5093659.1 PilN domain-containing protein [Patescibacteria group bacterium]